MVLVNNSVNINASNPLSPLDGGLGVSNPTAHGILVAEGSSAANSITLTNGQLLIGITGSDPSPAQLTPGTGIQITSLAGSIQIANSAAATSFVDETSASVTMVTNTRYLTDYTGGLLTYTLPTSATVGDQIAVYGKQSGGWKIAQAASQQIFFGTTSTTSGTGGSLASTQQYDCVHMICLTGSTWVVDSSVGNLTVT